VGKRREFLRAVRDGDGVRLAGSQDSSALSALALADCLIDRPADAPALAAGSAVPVFRSRMAEVCGFGLGPLDTFRKVA
jgi:molybdopterin molybdotransferase